MEGNVILLITSPPQHCDIGNSPITLMLWHIWGLLMMEILLIISVIFVFEENIEQKYQNINQGQTLTTHKKKTHAYVICKACYLWNITYESYENHNTGITMLTNLTYISFHLWNLMNNLSEVMGALHSWQRTEFDRQAQVVFHPSLSRIPNGQGGACNNFASHWLGLVFLPS